MLIMLTVIHQEMIPGAKVQKQQKTIHQNSQLNNNNCFKDDNYEEGYNLTIDPEYAGTDPGGWMGWLATHHEWPCNYSDM